MSDFTPITTQEEFDSAIKSRLAREKEKYADYDDLKSRVAELETENGALQSSLEAAKASKGDTDKQIADLQAQISGFESEKLRNRIALENGLPLDLASRLQGEDEAALVADAERLAGLFKSIEPAPPAKSIEPNLGDEGDDHYRQLVQQLNVED